MSKTRLITVKIRPEVIALKRVELGINTSKELAKFLGVNPSMCSQIEREGSVSATVIKQVAEKLGLELNQLVKYVRQEKVKK